MAIVITDDDARRHLSMPDCIEAMRVCFRDFANGEAASLPRVRYTIPNGEPNQSYYANVHVGAVPSVGMACVRAGTHIINDSAYEDDRRSMRNPEPINWAVVILYDIKTSEPLAFMHESHVSGVRVGATSGVAVDEIARADASVLAVLGTGRQGRAHMEAVCAVRPIKEVRVYSPTSEHLSSFIDQMAQPGLKMIAAASEREAVDGADIICCTTNTTTPVLKGEWLSSGQMVVSIANSDRTIERREVDAEVFARASDIVIHDWDSVQVNNQIELLECLENGAVDRENVHLLGDIVAGKTTVKSTPDNIVYYKSNTGLAMQFAAAGAIIYEGLMKVGTNRSIPREWLAAEQYGIG